MTVFQVVVVGTPRNRTYSKHETKSLARERKQNKKKQTNKQTNKHALAFSSSAQTKLESRLRVWQMYRSVRAVAHRRRPTPPLRLRTHPMHKDIIHTHTHTHTHTRTRTHTHTRCYRLRAAAARDRRRRRRCLVAGRHAAPPQPDIESVEYACSRSFSYCFAWLSLRDCVKYINTNDQEILSVYALRYRC